MRIPLTVSLFLTLALIHPGNMSGSGSGLDSSGSGSGDWSEQGEVINDHSSDKDVRIFAAGEGTENTFNVGHVGASVPTFDNNHWLSKDSRSGFVFVANSKSFLGRKDVFAGVIAGGVAGVILAATLAAILIYKWHKTDGGYTTGQQRSSGEDYHISNREGVV